MSQKETEIIDDLLYIKYGSQKRCSCLIMALKSARKHTGRDVITGNDISGLINDDIFNEDLYHSENFTGLTMYLILLEMIGSIFKKIGHNEKDIINGIRIALDNFTNLSDDEKKAIKALRNCLAHNFGLAGSEYHGDKNKTKNKKEQLFRFCLLFDDNHPAILPNLTWNGDFNDKEEDTLTFVGVGKLCDIVESVYSNLIFEYEKGNIELRIKDLNEIKARFTVI